MKNKDRYTKTVTLVRCFEIEGCTIDDIISKLQKIKKDYSNVSNLRLVGDDPYHCCDYDIEANRLETDAEYNKRIEKAEKRKATIKERELKELAKLKEKYE